jgi:hypothetical protein
MGKNPLAVPHAGAGQQKTPEYQKIWAANGLHDRKI